MGKRRVFEGKF